MSRDKKETFMMTEDRTVREFDRQVENLVQKGYLQAAGMRVEEFVSDIHTLEDRLTGIYLPELAIALPDGRGGTGHLAFVIVVKSDMVAPEIAMSYVKREGQHGFTSFEKNDIHTFLPIDGIYIPVGSAYLLVDIDRGQSTLDVGSSDALKIITDSSRSPLTIEEGIAVVTHYPDFLDKENSFSLLGSRSGDERVPALWISDNKPKLGWQRQGNSHVRLGSASCGSRIGIS